MSQTATSQGAAVDPGTLLQTVSDYVTLTKPRIIQLLVLTTGGAMVVAARGWPGTGLFLWTLLGTALVCGSAQVVNMVWDRDIDAVMERTNDRPIPQGRIGSESALLFSGVLGTAGLMILSGFTNSLAAFIALAGHVYYSVVYTMWLKRRTPHNIVIGGGAGAFPPLIGWAAVTGQLGAAAWLLFGIVFLWTPPHFWALALYKDIDYEEAGVPMMPVACGRRTTKFQMLLYTALLLGATVLFGLVGLMGLIYLATAIVLGAGFAYCCIRTAFETDSNTWAKRTFAFSIVYLGLLFGGMSADVLSPYHFTIERQQRSIEQRAERIRNARSLRELRALNGQTLPPDVRSQLEHPPELSSGDD